MDDVDLVSWMQDTSDEDMAWIAEYVEIAKELDAVVEGGITIEGKRVQD